MRLPKTVLTILILVCSIASAEAEAISDRGPRPIAQDTKTTSELNSILNGTTTNVQAAETCARDTNVEIIQCMDKQLKIAESRLADAYKAALNAQAGGKWHQLVVGSQRLWIASREKDCRELVAFQWSGGSGEGNVISSCLVARDDERTKVLRDIAKGE